MSTEDQTRYALQLLAAAEPVDLPALAAKVRTRRAARKRRRAITLAATCVGLVLATVATVPRLVDRDVTAAASTCPQPVPAGYRQIDTKLDGTIGVVPPGWTLDMEPSGAVGAGSLQVTNRPVEGNFVIYRYDPEPGVASVKEFEDASNVQDDHQLPGFRLIRSAPTTYGTAQQAWDSDYEFSSDPTSRAYRRDWWIDGRLYSVFFIARASDWDRLADVRQVVLGASRPC